MFYSHDILNNTQYGIAMVWLAATMGKGTAAGKGALRKLTRKAVQGVDVPKACETILNPGAPLALRLQGSLLYGLSRVFSEQCRYVLSDAAKTQSHMMTFFRSPRAHQTDPEAGKTRRHLITLEDDPDFDLSTALPSLDLLRLDQTLAAVPSQASSNKFSFMTPRDALGPAGISSLGQQPRFMSLAIPSSSLGADSYRLPSDLGHCSSPLARGRPGSQVGSEFRPFADEELDSFGGVSLDFDADGNLLGVTEPDAELPPLPGAAPGPSRLPRGGHGLDGGPDGQPLLSLDEAASQPKDGAPPRARRAFSTKASEVTTTVTTTETTETEASARHRAGRRRRIQHMLDHADRVSREEFRGWTDHYVRNMDAGRKRFRTTTAAQARKNAFALLYGNGIAGIGLSHGSLEVAHPLTDNFAGQALRMQIHGLHPGDDAVDSKQVSQGRRRKSPEAFAVDDTGRDAGRNVHPRVEQEDAAAEVGRGAQDAFAPEMGMDEAPAMDDRHSLSVMPWSRPASAARGQVGSARKGAPSPSPLHRGRGGSLLGPIEHLSDPVETPLGAAVAAPGSLLGSSSPGFGLAVGPLDFGRDGVTQPGASGLDVTSHDFLGYVAAAAAGRRWIAFDALARPGSHSRAVAAQAFLNLLVLASSGVVAVAQPGATRHLPFGTIHVAFPAGPGPQAAAGVFDDEGLA